MSSGRNPNNNCIDCVSILAGGGGTRLWPASTEQRPKQFMNISSPKSLLLQTLERSWALQPRIGVFVICNQQYCDEILCELARLPQQQARSTYVLLEPCMRNTAVALFYANQLMEQVAGPEAVNLVQTSDHLIGPPASFAQAVAQATELACHQKIVVFGLEPRYPASGYGYIERGAALEASSGKAYQVLRFTEKPNEQLARQFLAQGSFCWNSGMFCYSVGLFREELGRHSPGIVEILGPPSCSLSAQLEEGAVAGVLRPSTELTAAYDNCENISIDYALMEKTEKLALLYANFDWNDIGSWDVLAELEQATEQTKATLVEVGGSTDNFVRSSLPVALCNVSGLIVVEENGMLLICRKGSSELVKEARTQMLEKRGSALDGKPA